MLIDDYIEYQKKYEERYGSQTIVLMEVGHFFEFYGVSNDEEQCGNVQEVAELLNIQMTRRNKSILENSRSNPLMAGFPSASLHRQLSCLIKNNNYTVILIEQTTPPPNPERKVTHVYSPATYIEDINSFDSNNIVSIFYQDEKCYNTGKNLTSIGLCMIDLTTGRSNVYEISSKTCDINLAIEETVRFINTYNPKEVLFHRPDYIGDNSDLYHQIEISNRIIQDKNIFFKDY